MLPIPLIMTSVGGNVHYRPPRIQTMHHIWLTFPWIHVFLTWLSYNVHAHA